MSTNDLNERLALALGWRRDPNCPSAWTQPDSALPFYVRPRPDYLSGDGMLALLEAMRGQRFSIKYRFAEELNLVVAGGRAGAQVDWPWALMHVTPEQIAAAALAALETDPPSPPA